MAKRRHRVRQLTKTLPKQGEHDRSYLKQSTQTSPVLPHMPHEPAESPPPSLLQMRRPAMRSAAATSVNASSRMGCSEANDVAGTAQQVHAATEPGWRIVRRGDSIFEVNDIMAVERQLPSWLFQLSSTSPNEAQDKSTSLCYPKHPTEDDRYIATMHLGGDKTPPLSEWQNAVRRNVQ